MYKVKDAEVTDANFKLYLSGAGKLVENIKKLGESADSVLNNEVAIKIISSFTDNFNALNLYLLEANMEMGVNEMPEINKIVNDAPKIKQFLTEGDCAILQDEYSIKDLCTKMDEIKSTECDVDQLKSLNKSEDAPGMEALSGVQTENTESTCDPEIASALGNLDE